jgi:hypothetical protein
MLIICFIIFQAIIDDIKDNKPQKDIINDVRELSIKNIIPEHEVITIVSSLVVVLFNPTYPLIVLTDLDNYHGIGRMEQERRIGR